MITGTAAERGTGRTHRAMQAAPKGAVYICPAGLVRYCREMAKKIDRSDLHVVPSNWLSDYRWAGLLLAGIVVDHGVNLTETEAQGLERAQACIR